MSGNAINELQGGSPADECRDPLVGWPSAPPPGYLGQLEPAFQAALAREHGELIADDCDWYHTQVLSNGQLVRGQWDLRGRERAYVGGVDLGGKRVLEPGPASGYLTYWMEAQGAAITAFEVGYDAPFELLPAIDATDFRASQSDMMRHVGRINDSWWFRHRESRSTARIAYGNIYNLPADLGRFDIAFLGCILIHLHDPFRALQQVAAHTDHTIVVTDLRHPGLEGSDEPLARFGSDIDNLGPSNRWWDLSPGAVTRMLWRLGFVRTRLLLHSQLFEAPHGPVEVGHFTVAADRATPDELVSELALRSVTPTPRKPRHGRLLRALLGKAGIR